MKIKLKTDVKFAREKVSTPLFSASVPELQTGRKLDVVYSSLKSIVAIFIINLKTI